MTPKAKHFSYARILPLDFALFVIVERIMYSIDGAIIELTAPHCDPSAPAQA
jgi:hypothetical protein